MPDKFGRLTDRERRSAALYRVSNIFDPLIAPDAKLTGKAGAVRIARGAGCSWEEISAVTGTDVKRLEEIERM